MDSTTTKTQAGNFDPKLIALKANFEKARWEAICRPSKYTRANEAKAANALNAYIAAR